MPKMRRVIYQRVGRWAARPNRARAERRSEKLVQFLHIARGIICEEYETKTNIWEKQGLAPVPGLDGARAALESSGRFPAEALTEVVARSWERCVARGLDPTAEPRSVLLPFTEVKAKRERNSILRRLALAEMQQLYAQIAGSDFMIAFADPEGVVLDTISDSRFAASRAGRNIVPGSVWCEEESGTNALGLAVMSAAPAAIYGREHFFASHGQLSCMAVPIFDPAGEVAGIIDASCSNEARQQHTHALLRMAATEIENGLIFRDRSSSIILAFHPRMEYVDTLSAGLVTLTAHGEVRAINRPGRALLSGLALAEASFEDLFDARFGATMDSLLGDGVVRVRDRAGSAVYIVVRHMTARGNAPALQHHPAMPSRILPAIADVGFVCDDPILRKNMDGLAFATKARMTVHIRGETGTGKELMARHVHAVSGRNGEFVAVNCGAIPEQLFVSELFGHERGAYTNARNDGSPGLIRIADKGTLFLDEVADIPLAAQTALLRFLDSMEIRPVGGQKAMKVDVQIVSATNRDLREQIVLRNFRNDLFYRLNALTIELPALRDRHDFAAIVRHLLEKSAPATSITDEAITCLRERPWPGNIRELQAYLLRMIIAVGTNYLDETAIAADGDIWDVCTECASNSLNRIKCRQIRETYAANGSNISSTARSLGISRTTVYKHVDRPAANCRMTSKEEVPSRGSESP
jgi:sigma-54 dependent transcriptional regulator, acetoin dehydrogenase operon transcriptional activator AcoR